MVFVYDCEPLCCCMFVGMIFCVYVCLYIRVYVCVALLLC